MDALVQTLVWLNALASALAWGLLGWVALVPGWLSATVLACVTGVLLLIAFKYTSHQEAILRVRRDIDAHLLSLKLFRDSARVALRAQGCILWGALRLMLLALVPMVLMALPVTLLLGQLALWYQARPLHTGEQAVVTLKLSGPATAALPGITLQPTSAVAVTLGPVQVQSKHEVCWNLEAREPGTHQLVFLVDGQPVRKELVIDPGYQRVSLERPGQDWSAILLHPWESPFTSEDPVRSITIDYPSRDSWISGTDNWVIYWFVVSMLAAFCFRGVFNVKV